MIVAIVSSVAVAVTIVFTVYLLKCFREKWWPSISITADGGALGSQADRAVMRDTHVDVPTMERFFDDMARERPVRFSAQDLAGFTRNYATRLGSGGFGVVYKGEFPNGLQVAVKVLSKNMDKWVEEQFMTEVSTIGRTHHINLVRLHGYCFDLTMKALVYEYMEKGSLDKYLFDWSRSLEWERLREIAVGTAKAIAYLHEECQKRIIHYDIKPGNNLLDANFSPKVADFGLAKLCDRDITHISMTRGRGTPGYAAPELWMPLPVTHQCDVYSFGMLLFEIVGRRRNVDVELPSSQEWMPRWMWEKLDKGLIGEAMTAELGAKEENRGEAVRMAKVALWCVQYLPADRPSMSRVVKMLEGDLDVAAAPNPFRHLAPGDTSSHGSLESLETNVKTSNGGQK